MNAKCLLSVHGYNPLIRVSLAELLSLEGGKLSRQNFQKLHQISLMDFTQPASNINATSLQSHYVALTLIRRYLNAIFQRRVQLETLLILAKSENKQLKIPQNIICLLSCFSFQFYRFYLFYFFFIYFCFFQRVLIRWTAGTARAQTNTDLVQNFTALTVTVAVSTYRRE